MRSVAIYTMKVMKNTNNLYIERNDWCFSDECYYRLISYETEAVTVTYHIDRETLEVHTLILNPSKTTRKHINNFILLVANDLMVSDAIYRNMLDATKNDTFRRITIH